MSAFLMIAWNSFRELLRQPVYLALLTGPILLIGLLANVSYFGFGEEARLVKTTSLSILLLSGMAGAALGAAATLSREIRTGTALSLLAKPVGRACFLAGKYVGVSAALCVQATLGLLAALLASRMAFDAYGSPDWLAVGLFFGAIALAFALGLASNYLTHRPLLADASLALVATFAGSFLVINALDRHGSWQSFGVGVDWRLVPAGMLVLLALLALAGIAIACSARLALLPTLFVCSCSLVLGLLADYLFGVLVARDSWIAVIAHALIPNWQHFWLADALGGERSIPWPYVAKAAGYAGAYSALSLTIGVLLFEDRELH